MRFKDRVAVVTGAAKGLGKATAIKFARAGAKVALIDIDRESLDDVSHSIESAGSKAIPFVVDITQNDYVMAAMAEVLSKFNRADILVNNAGAGWRGRGVGEFKDLRPEDWEYILDLNVKGTLYCTGALLKHMVERKYGKIINITSVAASAGLARFAVYAASKGAIVSFTKSLAMEVGQHGINVNAVSPGLITEEEPPPAHPGTFLGRMGSTWEMASLILFLASQEASFITGAEYLIDGGRVLGPRGT